MRSIERRLTALEGVSTEGDIPIWVDQEDQVAAAVDEMIRSGDITEADRTRSVHWEKASCAPGTHETRLDELLARKVEENAPDKSP